MGNSCLEYRGKHKFVDDFEVKVVALSIAYCLLQFIQRKTIDGDIPEFASAWKADFPEFGSGAVDLRLDHFFPDKQDGVKLLRFIEDTKDVLISGNDFISERKLNEWMSEDLTFVEGGIHAKKIEGYFNKFSSFIVNALA